MMPNIPNCILQILLKFGPNLIRGALGPQKPVKNQPIGKGRSRIGCGTAPQRGPLLTGGRGYQKMFTNVQKCFERVFNVVFVFPNLLKSTPTSIASRARPQLRLAGVRS